MLLPDPPRGGPDFLWAGFDVCLDFETDFVGLDDDDCVFCIGRDLSADVLPGLWGDFDFVLAAGLAS